MDTQTPTCEKCIAYLMLIRAKSVVDEHNAEIQCKVLRKDKACAVQVSNP